MPVCYTGLLFSPVSRFLVYSLFELYYKPPLLLVAAVVKLVILEGYEPKPTPALNSTFILMNLRSGRGAARDGLEPIVPNGDDLPSVPGSDADHSDEGEDDGNGRDIHNPPGINPAGRRVQPHFNNRKFKAVLNDARRVAWETVFNSLSD